MSKFPAPPVDTDFQKQGQPSPTFAWEQWFQAISAFLSAMPQGFSVTHAQRLALKGQAIGSIVFETDTNHVLAWNGLIWVTLV
jgi:hypothetical protein